VTGIGGDRVKKVTAKLIVSALVVSFLVLPAGLSAKEKRGANLIVTRLDGSQVAGELIAVKRDSLLLLGEGTDVTVGLAGIKSVRIVRKSRAKPLALIGFLSGAAEGAYIVSRDEEDRNTKTTLLAAGIFGGIQGLLGLGIGLGLGADAVLPFAGEADGVVARYLDRLKGRSREGRMAALPAARELKPEVVPAGALAQSSSARRPRFRLILGATFPVPSNRSEGNQPDPGMFFFPGDVPPPEKGPYPAYFQQIQAKRLRNFWAGPVGLSYDWTEHWSAGIEFQASGRSGQGHTMTILPFTSSLDGKNYIGEWDPGLLTSFVSALVGLTYRTKTTTVYEQHAFEIGAAAGPAWGRLGVDPGSAGLLSAETVNKISISARVQGGYEFLFTPHLSAGAIVGYHFLEMTFPGSTCTSDVAFSEQYSSAVPAFTRTTEITFSVRTMSWSGPFLGLRLIWRFR